MLILNLVLVLFIQAPVPAPAASQKVVVGLDNGRQITMENPEFSGFIYGRAGDAVLRYRQEKLRGDLPMKSVARIDFGPYEKGKPFPMTVTLRSGQKLEVQSQGPGFVTVKGKTDVGTVIVNHPDPTSLPPKITTKKPNREKDLTIQYLEIPAP